MKRAPVANLEPGETTLSEETSGYLCRVLRMSTGDSFVAFDPTSHVEADAVLIEGNDAAARIRVGALREATLVAALDVQLIYSLSKGDKVDAVVRDATELGVTRVTVVRAARSVVKIDAAAADTKLDRWSRIAVEAARQCGRSDPPTVELADFEAAVALSTAEARFILDARAGRPLGALLKPVSTAFAIGPEGGFTESELDLAKKNAFSPAFLGRFTMRTETAPAAVLGAFLSRT